MWKLYAEYAWNTKLTWNSLLDYLTENNFNTRCFPMDLTWVLLLIKFYKATTFLQLYVGVAFPKPYQMWLT